MTEITMPRLSDSMEEGTILAWLKADGEYVAVGEPLIEIETDKAAMTCAAESAGILAILAADGTSLAVGALLARLSTATEPAPAATPVAEPTTPARPEPDPGAISNNDHDSTSARPLATKVTPLARRVAELHGIRLEQVVGTGPLGRITRADVLEMAGAPGGHSPAPRSAAPSGPPA